MAFWTRLGINGPTAALLGLLLVVIIGGGLGILLRGDRDAEVAAEATTERPAAIVSEAVKPAPAETGSEPTEQADAAASPVDEPAAGRNIPEPVLDVVRVDREGSTVLAGTAAGSARVVISLDGEDLSEVETDAAGKFVALFDLPPSTDPRFLSVETIVEDGVRITSDAKILIAPAKTTEVAEADAPASNETPNTVEEDVVAEAEDEAASTGASVAGEDVASATDETKAAEVELPEIADAAKADAAGETAAESIAASAQTEGVEELAEVVDNAADEVSETVEKIAADITGTQASNETPADEATAEIDADQQVADAPVSDAQDAANTVETAQLDDVQPDASPTSESPALVEAPQPIEAPAEEVASDPAPETAAAPAIVVADATGLRLVQPAEQPAAPKQIEGAPEVTSNVVIDTITYNTDGEVALSGRGARDGFVRVYLNDRPVLTAPIGEDGSWATPLPEVDAGVYTLRIDEVTPDGTVTSRVETPFQREEISLAANAAGAVTVQPGFTLWAIAEANFGSGAQFVRVYEANRELIRDPDLIYPGQVFEIPETQ